MTAAVLAGRMAREPLVAESVMGQMARDGLGARVPAAADFYDSKLATLQVGVNAVSYNITNGLWNR